MLSLSACIGLFCGAGHQLDLESTWSSGRCSVKNHLIDGFTDVLFAERAPWQPTFRHPHGSLITLAKLDVQYS